MSVRVRVRFRVRVSEAQVSLNMRTDEIRTLMFRVRLYSGLCVHSWIRSRVRTARVRTVLEIVVRTMCA